MEKDQDPVSDVDHMDPLFDVTIYIYADTVLGKQHRNLDSKSMNRRK